MNSLFIILIPLLPLLAFLANGLLGRWLRRGGGWLAVAALGGSAAISLGLLVGALAGGIPLPIDVPLWNWFAVGRLNLNVSFHVDQLTCLMLSFITLVSFLVFLYSMGYMEGDAGFNRFFSYMGLFDFSMLLLVLGSSLPVLFVGWEGVGLCSYLLIGYYLDMPGAAGAGTKAFVVNRIGDFGFLVAMFMIFHALGTLDIQQILAAAPRHPLLAYGGAYVTILTLMLFLGCTGKSAQIPLFVWLPDAMAGPTPVSALIHAATMVTAGVYLVVRMSALFALAPLTMQVMAVVAALTAVVAGSIALTQRDIKKVLAYSTISQLGYMFLACGCGAFIAGLFHVFTHSFFKAGLFLGAGSVIHAAHLQDMNLLGGLRRRMPQTWLTFLVACLAIAGFPLTAGFFSKDEILSRTLASGHVALYLLGLVTALMTAIYSFRLLFLTFHGVSRMPEDARGHLHESPWTMTLPLWILAGGALLAGWLNLPAPFLHLLRSRGESGIMDAFLSPMVQPAQAIMAAHAAQVQATLSLAPRLIMEWAGMGVSVLIALAGIVLAFHFCLKAWPGGASRLAERLGFIYQISYHRWWWDDFYYFAVVGGVWQLARLATWFDEIIIDGALYAIAAATRAGSRWVRLLQNGQVQAYALAILIGVNLILWLILKVKS